MASIIGKYKKYNFEKEVTLFKGIDDIYEQKIVIPDPPNIRDVINYNVPTSKQKWEAQPSPLHLRQLEKINVRKKNGQSKTAKQVRYDSLTLEDHKYILGEYVKMWETGDWVMINGNLTWIPPDYYFFLSRWTVAGNKPLYIDSQRRWYLHWWHLDNKKDCYGLIEMTKRRDGKSSRMGQVGYKKSISGFEHNVGIQSKDEESALDFFEKMVVVPWRNMPFWLVSNFSNSTKPKDEISWFKKAEMSQTAMDELSGDDELRGWVRVMSSDALKFDGKKLACYLVEEPGKTKNENIYDRYYVVKPTMKEFDKIVGKSIHSTTVEDMEKMGGANFVELWDDSSRKNDSDTSDTISGLQQHFTPAYDGYIVDEFGRSKITESRDALLAARDKLKNKPAKLVKEMRKYPFTIREAIQAAGGENPFDIYKITQRSTYFMNKANDQTRVGYWDWVEGQKYRKVRWIDDPNGSGVVSYLFENPSQANKMISQRGKLRPVNNKFTAGADPYRYKETQHNRQSLAACAIWWDHDPAIDQSDDPSKWVSNRFVYTYLGRTKTKEGYAEQMLMACIYYGAMMYPEIQVTMIWDYFDRMGFDGYLLYDVNKGRRSTTPGFNSNEKNTPAGMSEVEWYVDKWVQYEKHPEIVEAIKTVDIDKLKDHDLFIAILGALLGAARRRSKFTPHQETLDESVDNHLSEIIEANTFVIGN